MGLDSLFYFPLFLTVAAMLLPSGMMELSAPRRSRSWGNFTRGERLWMALIFFSVTAPAWVMHAAPFWWMALVLTLFSFAVATMYAKLDSVNEFITCANTFPKSGYFIFAALFSMVAWFAFLYYWLARQMLGVNYQGMLNWTA